MPAADPEEARRVKRGLDILCLNSSATKVRAAALAPTPSPRAAQSLGRASTFLASLQVRPLPPLTHPTPPPPHSLTRQPLELPDLEAAIVEQFPPDVTDYHAVGGMLRGPYAVGDNSGCGAEAAELIEQRVVKHELLQRQVARVRCPANSAAKPCQLCSQTSAGVQGLHKLGSSHGWGSILELQLKQADCWAVTVPAAVTSPPVAAAAAECALQLPDSVPHWLELCDLWKVFAVRPAASHSAAATGL